MTCKCSRYHTGKCPKALSKRLDHYHIDVEYTCKDGLSTRQIGPDRKRQTRYQYSYAETFHYISEYPHDYTFTSNGYTSTPNVHGCTWQLVAADRMQPSATTEDSCTEESDHQLELARRFATAQYLCLEVYPMYKSRNAICWTDDVCTIYCPTDIKHPEDDYYHLIWDHLDTEDVEGILDGSREPNPKFSSSPTILSRAIACKHLELYAQMPTGLILKPDPAARPTGTGILALANYQSPQCPFVNAEYYGTNAPHDLIAREKAYRLKSGHKQANLPRLPSFPITADPQTVPKRPFLLLTLLWVLGGCVVRPRWSSAIFLIVKMLMPAHKCISIRCISSNMVPHKLSMSWLHSLSLIPLGTGLIAGPLPRAY